jgi:hypothetical protein
MSLAQERAAWGVSIPRAFTREEKKLWTKEEKGMYKAFELHGKDQALKLMRAYFARKRSSGGDDEQSLERGVSMTCSLPKFRSVGNGETSDDGELVFGDGEKKRFKQAILAIKGLENLEESAISITKVSDSTDENDKPLLIVTFEISISDGTGDDESLSAVEIASKLSEPESLTKAFKNQHFSGTEIVHAAEVIGGRKAAKKARKSMMDEMYGDHAKAATSEGEKHDSKAGSSEGEKPDEH